VVNIKGDGMMDAQVVNFKAYNSGAMVGFFDLVVGGIVVTGCKVFCKDDRYWFAWPSEKTTDAAGEVKYRDIVTAAEPVMRHLQNMLQGQLRASVEGQKSTQAPRAIPKAPGTASPTVARPKPRTGAYRMPEGEDLSQYRTKQGADDIAF
jgi:hypothetical protein